MLGESLSYGMNLKINDSDLSGSSVISIEKLVYGGDGLGRLDGQVVLVPLVLPGETVQVKPERVKKGLLRGAEPQVLAPAPERIVPRCEYFGSCGGCQYQHLDHALQLEQKRNILLETLARTGGITNPREVRIVSADPWNYRNRIQLHFSGRQMGFHKLGSHQLREIDHCEISSPLLNEVIKTLRDATREPEWPNFLNSLEVFTNETNVQLNVMDSDRPVAARFFEWCADIIPQFSPGSIDYRAADRVFRISGGSFFQVNRFLIDRMVQEVVNGFRGSTAVDLYSGVGLFTLPLATRFERVRAVERSVSAIRDLEFNAKVHGVAVEAEKGSAEDFLRRMNDTPDLILADPPRAGLGKEAAAELLRLRAPNVVIVSCDPTTLARDLKTLLTTYELESITLIDLFPQTYHLETIVKLRAR
jgi:23S rRNA (uracil1939-C5)-methyltransferase